MLEAVIGSWRRTRGTDEKRVCFSGGVEGEAIAADCDR